MDESMLSFVDESTLFVAGVWAAGVVKGILAGVLIHARLIRKARAHIGENNLSPQIGLPEQTG